MQVLIGQPFDLVKVRLQAASTNTGGAPSTPLSVFKQTLTQEGPLAFYKGTLAPLLGVGACVSVQFYAFHEAKRFFQGQNQKEGEANVKTTALGLTYPQIYAAGAAAGIANTPLTSPIEQVRILLQTQRSTKDGSGARWNGPRDVVKDLKANRALFRGSGVTVLREAQAYGVWFATYEYVIAALVDRLQRVRNDPSLTRNDLPTPYLLGAGAVAGEALWLASYPLDVVKSRVQADGLASAGESRYGGSAIRAAQDVWRTQGIRGFWRGIVPTLLRAIPASSGTFAAVELTLRVLG